MQYELLRIDSPLHYYCMTGDVHTTLKLLNTGDDELFSMDDLHCWTPAHWAANYGRTECLRLLKEHDATSTPSFRSMTLPLHIAAERGHLDCLRLLLDGDCKINTQDYQGDTALHKAVRGGHMSCIQALVAAGARADIKNFSSRTPSEIAALSGYFEIATALNEIARINRIQISHTDTPIAFDSHGPVPNSRKRSSRGVDEVLDKRRKFTDPVLQLATDMVAQPGAVEQTNLQTSVMEHAACMRMADSYADHYASYMNMDQFVRQC
ncbi:Ankyrin repeat domain containing protein 10 [Fasciolopsis buskii]|uniref:Ankyrin repeat domain containing protein 10 n=1 Tax=Fasciolopsis buskii TaxID=27845 RepID=A0A8E0S048_9TREM|nr:Ankyrin repeat domain containing protein 10 [Fasciolopsis buski]